MEQWYVSDHHLWHDNIINFCNRPFDNVTQMGEALLTYHNELVKPQDHVNFLGDVTLLRGSQAQRGKFIKEIRKYHGHKRLFLGNHDHWPIRVYLDAGFEKIYASWRTNGGILLSHIPVHPSSVGSAIANVHGHIHNSQSSAAFPPVVSIDKKTQRVTYRPYVNVCVEVTNYRPITLEQVMSRINKERGEYEGTKV